MEDQMASSIAGTVVDPGPDVKNPSPAPIAKARIKVSDAKKQTFTAETEANGSYIVENVPAGEYTVECEAFGETPKPQTVTVRDAVKGIDFEIPVRLSLTLSALRRDGEPRTLQPADPVPAGTVVILHVETKLKNVKPVFQFTSDEGSLMPIPDNPSDMVFLTDGLQGASNLTVTASELN